jgi:predicted metal-dependent phosphoesterase TrpH
VRKAKSAGITVLALTDHDTTVGWAGASEAATQVGLTLVRGIELSVEDVGQGLHLLVYEPDLEDSRLVNLPVRSVEVRDEPIPALVGKIAVVVPALRLEDVLANAGDAVPGRPHVADVLVRCGASQDRAAAFAEYLIPGRPTYLETWSPPIEDAIRVVTHAGGVPVIAHPWDATLTLASTVFGSWRQQACWGSRSTIKSTTLKPAEPCASSPRTLG